jgi:hypothetical protein
VKFHKRTQILLYSCRVMHHSADARRLRFSPLLKLASVLLWFMGPLGLHAETSSGTIQDPSGAVIDGARIEISGGDLGQPLVLLSDGQGKFVSPDLKPATYSVRVTRDGCKDLSHCNSLSLLPNRA